MSPSMVVSKATLRDRMPGPLLGSPARQWATLLPRVPGGSAEDNSLPKASGSKPPRDRTLTTASEAINHRKVDAAVPLFTKPAVDPVLGHCADVRLSQATQRPLHFLSTSNAPGLRLGPPDPVAGLLLSQLAKW